VPVFELTPGKKVVCWQFTDTTTTRHVTHFEILPAE